ncbi:MAG: calcineurin-like phosphoesterase C-terminal domain-containing protein [Flavisolibacter sp.]
MKRKEFIQDMGWMMGGVVVSKFIPFKELLHKSKTVKGVVSTRGKGLSNVVISDGYNLVLTDKKGSYEFEPHAEATAVFISTPPGYDFVNEKGIARHYRLLSDVNLKKPVDFDLIPLNKDDNEHQFIIWADPQVKNAKDVEKMMQHSVPDVQKLVTAAGASTLLHGITVGDIVWDNHALFAEYDKAVEQMGISFFQCLGNHDMDYTNGSDESSDDTFQQTYGPTYYSFNRGQVHYVVMDNVRYLGKDREYDGFFQQNQLDWLQKDLAFVPNDKLVILCVHIPVHKGTKNREALYSLLQGRNVHIMSGHTHYNVNAVKENIYEHNHGTVCGAWWTGSICEDGTPNGYGVYKVKGTELSWYYQATGKDAGHQLRIAVNEFNADQKQVQVNIWNHDPAWKTEYFVDGSSQGALEQFEGFDLQAYTSMLGPNLPKSRSFAEPKKTAHLFKALIPAAAKEVTVVATDRFGKKYTETYSLTA